VACTHKMCVPYARAESGNGTGYEIFLVTKWNGISQVLSHLDILDDCHLAV
jgi:hypothetical protein